MNVGAAVKYETLINIPKKTQVFRKDLVWDNYGPVVVNSWNFYLIPLVAQVHKSLSLK